MTLSVTFGDTSPKGRGTGEPVRTTLDEEGSIHREMECLAVEGRLFQV
mgnify:CR=1 FL=1